MNILFVCTGNISRSFLAERLLKHEIKRHGLRHVSVASAGLHAYPGRPPDPEMVKFLLEMGIAGKNPGARQIEEEDLAWADIILVMEKAHAHAIKEQWPKEEGKVELLGRYLSGIQTKDDIPDPYGGSSYHYRTAQSQITLAVKAFFKSRLSRGEDLSRLQF